MISDTLFIGVNAEKDNLKKFLAISPLHEIEKLVVNILNSNL